MEGHLVWGAEGEEVERKVLVGGKWKALGAEKIMQVPEAWEEAGAEEGL